MASKEKGTDSKRLFFFDSGVIAEQADVGLVGIMRGEPHMKVGQFG